MDDPDHHHFNDGFLVRKFIDKKGFLYQGLGYQLKGAYKPGAFLAA
jgi:hypothetical protein